MVKLSFGPWEPDNYPGATGTSPLAKNVIPTATGYSSIKSPSQADQEQDPQAYSGIATTLWYEVAQDRQVFTFFATDTELYRLSGGLNVVGRNAPAAGNYTPIGDPGSVPWSSVAFGDTVLAVNGYDKMQALDMGGAATFADIDTNPNAVSGGSSNLTGRYSAVIRDFHVIAHVRDQGTSAVWSNRVQWSALNDPTDFGPSPQTQSDFQDIPDLGEVRGITGGEYGLILMERGVVRMDYVGPPTYFNFDVIKVGDGIGCDMPQTVIRAKAGTFFHAQHGWFVCDGQQIIPIGHNKIDEWWHDDVRQEDALRITRASLPDLHSVGWLYPSKSAPGYATGHPMQDGTLADNARIPNRILLFNIDEGKWSTADVEGEVLGNGSSDTSTQLDSLGDGVIPPNDQGTGPYPGGPEAGPAAGLDTPGFPSLDSSIWKGLAGATSGVWKQPPATMNNEGNFYVFEGQTMTGVVDTMEVQLTPGRRSRITRAFPLVEGSGNTVSLTPIPRVKHTPVNDGPLKVYQESASGVFRMRSEGRFHRMRVEVNGSWDRLHGVDVEFSAKGGR